MKNVFRINFVMMLILLIITSCSKDDDESPAKPKAITPAEMQNSVNPYDEQGETYNGFMNAIKEDRDIGNWDVGHLAAFNGDIGNWDVGHLAEYNGDIGNWDVGHLVSLGLDFSGKDSNDTYAREALLMQLESINDLGEISTHRDCWVHPEWCQDFTNPVDLLDSVNDDTSYDRTMKYINALKSLEAEINENDTMDMAEKKGLLICYSIARHSAGYWYNAIIGDDQPFPWDKHHVGYLKNVISLNTLGASTAFNATDSQEVGIPTAILTYYIIKKYG